MKFRSQYYKDLKYIDSLKKKKNRSHLEPPLVASHNFELLWFTMSATVAQPFNLIININHQFLLQHFASWAKNISPEDKLGTPKWHLQINTASHNLLCYSLLTAFHSTSATEAKNTCVIFLNKRNILKRFI